MIGRTNLAESKWFVLVGTLQNCIELLYICTLLSYQYNVECCKIFCAKIDVKQAYGPVRHEYGTWKIISKGMNLEPKVEIARNESRVRTTLLCP